VRPKEHIPADILASVLLSVVALLAVLLMPGSIWQIIALEILLIILGYVLTTVLFPGADDLVPLWRAALSLGTSVSCAATLIVSQSLSPREAGLDAIASVISAFAIFLSGLAYLKRIDLPRSRRFSPIPKRGIRFSGFSAPSMSSFKGPILILIMLLAVSAFAFTYISSQKETSSKDNSQLRVQGVGHDQKTRVPPESKGDDDNHPAAVSTTLTAVDTASPSMSPPADMAKDRSVEGVKSDAKGDAPQEDRSNVAESIGRTKAVFLTNGTSGSDKNRAESQKSPEDVGIANSARTQGTYGTSAASKVASGLSVTIDAARQSSIVNSQSSAQESSQAQPSPRSANIASSGVEVPEQEVDMTDQINEGAGARSSASASLALTVAKGSIAAVGSRDDAPQTQKAGFDVVIADKTQKDVSSSDNSKAGGSSTGASQKVNFDVVIIDKTQKGVPSLDSSKVSGSSTGASVSGFTASRTSAEDSEISEDDLSSDVLESSRSTVQAGSSGSSKGAQSSSGSNKGISSGSQRDDVSPISSDIKSKAKSSRSEIANEIDGWVSTRGLKAKDNGKESFGSKNIAFGKNGGRAILGSKANPVRVG